MLRLTYVVVVVVIVVVVGATTVLKAILRELLRKILISRNFGDSSGIVSVVRWDIDCGGLN